MERDFYSRKARQEGYLARSIYKLRQINSKHNIISKNSGVLDLGCSPGGWVQYCSELGCSITGIDINPVKINGRNFKFHKIDVFSDGVFDLPGKFDAVISDMAPKTTGIKDLDRARSYNLALRALEIAKNNLKPNGNFLAKVFQGDEFIKFLNECKKYFSFVKCDKPMASKSKSIEMYIICKGLKTKN